MGRFEDNLGLGEYWISRFGVDLERYDLRHNRLCSARTDFLVKERWELVSRCFTVVETADSHVAVVYFEDKLWHVVGPGSRVLFWRGPVEVTYDLIDAQSTPQAPALLVPALTRLGARESHATFALIDEGRRGLLYVNGRFVRELTPGSYAFWDAAGTVRVDIVELREQTFEILTREKVNPRVSISVTYQMARLVGSRFGREGRL